MDTLEPKKNHLEYPEWQEPLQAMLVEVDKEKLNARVHDLETAIFNRQQAIAGTDDHEAERHAIEDALVLLRALKRNELGFPDWEKK